MEKVLGQNGSGQNGTDKMVWTICYVDKMVLDKMARTKCMDKMLSGQNGIGQNGSGQNGTDKMARTKC